MSLSLEIERAIRRFELSSFHFQFSTFMRENFTMIFPARSGKFRVENQE